MTEEQMKKSQWLGRLYYARLRVNSLGRMKEKDREYSDKFMEYMPDCNDTALVKECRDITETIIKKSSERYIKALREYEIMRNEIEYAIDNVENYEYQVILSEHYIEEKSWRTIAEEMYFSLRTVKYKHLKALDLIDITA